MTPPRGAVIHAYTRAQAQANATALTFRLYRVPRGGYSVTPEPVITIMLPEED